MTSSMAKLTSRCNSASNDSDLPSSATSTQSSDDPVMEGLQGKMSKMTTGTSLEPVITNQV